MRISITGSLETGDEVKLRIVKGKDRECVIAGVSVARLENKEDCEESDNDCEEDAYEAWVWGTGPTVGATMAAETQKTQEAMENKL